MAKKMCLSRRAERLFVQIPICIAVVLGLSLMLTRFILVLKESLLESPADWKSFLFLAFLVGIDLCIDPGWRTSRIGRAKRADLRLPVLRGTQHCERCQPENHAHDPY